MAENKAGALDSNATQLGGPSDSATFKKPAIDPESKIPVKKKFKLFFATHYIGVLSVIIPLVFLAIMHPMPGQKHQWCAYTLSVMAAFWVFECLPLPITSFLPVIIFPMASIMSARATCVSYFNNTVMMFLGSIMLAASIEQSGLHIRIALYAIKCIGYSHLKVLFAVAFITMFMSMWITNTAAVTMMVPIVFALLKVYESPLKEEATTFLQEEWREPLYKRQKLFKIYDVNPKTKEETATPITSCYFCCITFAATNGGIGTLVGTATNLTFKGLFATTYKAAPEYISFPLYSGFAIPYMIVINLAMYMCLVLIYFGVGRPNSEAAKSVRIPPEGLKVAKEQVQKDIAKLGRLSCHEIMVLILFFGAMILFFARSPQVFPGWGDKIRDGFKIIFPKAYIKDATAAITIIWVMALLPSSNKFFKSFSAKFKDQLPQGPVTSVLDWKQMNLNLPYSFSFLLGGGFALSTGAKAEYSDLNGKIGDGLATLSSLPNAAVLLILIIFTIFITNFASNVAVCNVITPIAMQMAQRIGVNPLWYCVATGVAASFCYMIPVGTPGNLVVQSAAKVPTKQMIIAGAGPTIFTIFFTWLFCYLFAPVIWPILHDSKPAWIPK